MAASQALEAVEMVSTRAVLSPGKKPGLIAQAPTDHELRNLIFNRETKELSQAEPGQNSFIITRVEEDFGKILNPDQKRLWFRARITGRVVNTKHTYEAVIFGQNGISFEGTLVLEHTLLGQLYCCTCKLHASLCTLIL